MENNNMKLAITRILLISAIFVLLLTPLISAVDLLVHHNQMNGIFRYDGLTGVLKGIFDFDPELISVSSTGLAIGPDKNLYVSIDFDGLNEDKISYYNGFSGERIGIFIDGIPNPEGLAFSPNGDLYVVSKDGAVLHYDKNGVFIESLPLPLGGTSLSIAFDPFGSLYVSVLNGNIYKLQDSTFVSFISSSDVMPFGLTFGPDGDLYVADFRGWVIKRFDGITGAPKPSEGSTGVAVFARSSELSYPRALAFGPDNKLYVVGDLNGVLRFDGTTGEFIDKFASAIGSSNALVFIPTLKGDFNRDNFIDDKDIDVLCQSIVGGNPSIFLDINKDLVVNNNDLVFLVEEIIGTKQGDADLNKIIDAIDLAKVRLNFGLFGGWADGNFDCNNLVIDANDLAYVRTNFGFSTMMLPLSLSSGDAETVQELTFSEEECKEGCEDKYNEDRRLCKKINKEKKQCVINAKIKLDECESNCKSLSNLKNN